MFYDLGDVAALTITVKDSTGTPANGGAVAVAIVLPDGSTATPTPTNTATGVYSIAYVTSQAGRHRITWTVSGVNANVFGDVFDVRAANPRFIISLADARDACNLASSNTSHDDELRSYIAAATDVVESIAGPVLSRTLTETYDGGCTTVLLRNVPVTSVQSVTDSTVTLAATDYAFDPVAGTLTRMAGIYPWRFRDGQQTVTVAYTVGATSVPDYVILAARELVRHWYQRGQQSPRPAFGMTGDDGITYAAGYAIPNYVTAMLSPAGGIPGIA